MLNQPNPAIPDKFIACKIDISEHCSPELLARCGGALYLSGFYNDAVDTFICSAERMIFVDVIELVPEQYPDEEDLAESLNSDLIELHTEDDSGYYSRHDIERLRGAHPDRFKEIVGVDFEDYRNPSDAVRADLQGNPVF
jgi:hypothetical protein